MNLNLSNKSFIISGSGKGLGLKMVEILLKEGANVVITGRKKNQIKNQFKILESKFGSKVAYVDGDITNNSTLKKIKNIVKRKWNRLDGIVANAGLGKTKISNFVFLEKNNHII